MKIERLPFFKDENPNDFVKDFLVFVVNFMLLKECLTMKTKNVKVTTEVLEIHFYLMRNIENVMKILNNIDFYLRLFKQNGRNY